MTPNLDLGREARVATGLEVRRALPDAPDHLVQVRGYASVTGVPYPVAGGPENGGWTEIMERGAFKRTLGINDNRALLLHHDGAKVLATTRTGELRMSEDGVGLLVEADLDTRVSWLNDIALQVENGTIDEMSIGFYTRGRDWSDDYNTRTITEVELLEATITWAGANGATVATIERSRDLVMEARSANTIAKPDRVRIAARAALALMDR
jgi:HK97 family phage prohead protease